MRVGQWVWGRCADEDMPGSDLLHGHFRPHIPMEKESCVVQKVGRNKICKIFKKNCLEVQYAKSLLELQLVWEGVKNVFFLLLII